MTDKIIPGQQSIDGIDMPQKVRAGGQPRKLPIMGNNPGEPGFDELFNSDSVVDHDKVDGTPAYIEARSDFWGKSTGEQQSDETASTEKEPKDGPLYISYDKFIENVDGYLTGYLYAKQELEMLESERIPDRITGKQYQPGFDYKRWEKLRTQTVSISAAFRGLREQALSEKPELKELFDQFLESKKNN